MRRALASAAAALLLAGCGGGSNPVTGQEEEAPRQTLTVATGGTGGIYAVYGTQLASAITGGLDGYRGRARETTGSVENLQRLEAGRAQIALTLADTALDAVEGREAFRRPVPMRALAQIYPSYVQLVTKADSPIKTLQDLAGRRVSVGSPDSGTQVVAERALDVAGVVPTRERLGVADSAKALEAGDIDAFFWSGGVPTEAITALSKRTPIALVDLAPWTREMRARWGGVYERAPIPAGTYGLSEPVPTVGIPNYIVVDEHMDTGLAHDVTKLLFDARLVTDKARAQQVIAPVGLHAGAQDYYGG
jgi:TRAP transporter TAXI family solute receptor